MVLRNNTYGGMKRDQISNVNDRVIGTELFVSDLGGLAALFGTKGEKITSPQDLRPVLEKHLSSDDLTVLDIALAE